MNSRLIAEMQVDGTPLREYIYLDGEPIALKEYQTNPGTYYFINDHLGTPQRLVNGSGNVVWQAAYLPFGKAQVTVELVGNNLRFPGQYFDAETGLHYNWHRFYDPETGRYISADPIGLDGGMNLYAYVQNNPVDWIDPEGLAIGVDNQGKARGASNGSFEGHCILGGGYSSYTCCDRNELVEVSVVKACLGVAVGISATAGKNGSGCDGVKVGDFAIGPEAGIGVGVVGAEGALTFSKKGGMSPSGAAGWGFGKLEGKLTACTYWVIEVKKIGCCMKE